MPEANSTARQAQATAHDEEARTATAAAAADDAADDDDDEGTSGDDLPAHVRAALQRANRQAAKSRKELQQLRAQQEAEAEQRRQAQLTADQRAAEAEAKAKRAQEEAEAKIAHAQRLVALAGKVTHPERVLRLMDDPTAYFDDGTPDLDRIRADFPEYAPAAQADRPPPARAPGAAGAPPRKPTPDEAEADLLKRGDLTAYAAAVANRQAARRGTMKE